MNTTNHISTTTPANTFFFFNNVRRHPLRAGAAADVRTDQLCQGEFYPNNTTTTSTATNPAYNNYFIIVIFTMYAAILFGLVLPQMYCHDFSPNRSAATGTTAAAAAAAAAAATTTTTTTSI